MNNGKKYNQEVLKSVSNDMNISTTYIRLCLRDEGICTEKADTIRQLYNDRVDKINQELNL